MPHCRRHSRAAQPCFFNKGDSVAVERLVCGSLAGIVRYVGYVEDHGGLWLLVHVDRTDGKKLAEVIQREPLRGSKILGPTTGVVRGAFYAPETAEPVCIFVRPSLVKLIARGTDREAAESFEEAFERAQEHQMQLFEERKRHSAEIAAAQASALASAQTTASPVRRASASSADSLELESLNANAAAARALPKLDTSGAVRVAGLSTPLTAAAGMSSSSSSSSRSASPAPRPLEESVFASVRDLRPASVIAHCRALRDWTAEAGDECSFAAGDLLYITEKTSEFWWTGFVSPAPGSVDDGLYVPRLIPLSHVALLEPGELYCTVAWAAAAADELSAEPGDRLQLIERYESWILATNARTGALGLFPCTHLVDRAGHPALQAICLATQAWAAQDTDELSFGVGASLVALDKANTDWWSGYVVGQPDVVALFPLVCVRTVLDLHPDHAYAVEDPRVATCIALQAWVPEEDGELALQQGDRIAVYEKLNRFWWLGRREADAGHELSMFPLSHVQVVLDLTPEHVYADDDAAAPAAVQASATASHAWAIEEEGELALTPGEKISVLRFENEHWCTARSEASLLVGLCPLSHLRFD